MKKFFLVSCLFFSLVFYANAEGMAERNAIGTEKSDISYSFGMILAMDFIDSGLEFNYSSLIKGFRDAHQGADTRFSMSDAMEIAQNAYLNSMEKISEKNIQEENIFLADNASKEGVLVCESGLQFEILEEGSGEYPLISDTVKVHYEGSLINGFVFDSSYNRGEPEEFPLQGVIPGFSEGIMLTRLGGKTRMYIPSNLAYGPRGIGGIPPYSTLIFEIELLEIRDAEEHE